MKPQVMFRTRAHLSLEIVLSLGESVYSADERIWTGTYSIAFPQLLTDMYFAGGCTVMRHLAEATMLQKQGCSRRRCCFSLTSCVDAKVLLSILVKFTWLQSSGPAGLRYGVNANLIWVFGRCSCWPTAEGYCSLSLSLSVCLPAWRIQTQSVCFERRVKWLHSVSSSDSFISKPRARQEVPLRGVFNSDLVYSLFCLNKSHYFCVIVRVIYEFTWNWSVVLHFQMQSWFQQRQKSRWDEKGSRAEQR